MADISSTMFEAAREMEEAADDIEDAVKSGQVEAENIQDEMEKVYTNRGYAKQYRRVAQSMGMSIGTSTRDDSKGMKSLQRQVNQIVYSLQLAMNGYEQLWSNGMRLQKAWRSQRRQRAYSRPCRPRALRWMRT